MCLFSGYQTLRLKLLGGLGQEMCFEPELLASLVVSACLSFQSLSLGLKFFGLERFTMRSS